MGFSTFILETNMIEDNPMATFYKWVLAGACVVIMFLAGFYVEAVRADARDTRSAQIQQNGVLLNYSERITTLEVSRAYQDQMLADIKAKLDEIQRDIRTRR